MNLLANQYSFITFAVGLVVIAGLILLTNKPKWNDYLAFGVIIIGLFTAWSILHPRQTLLMDDAKMVRDLIGAGTPTFIFFDAEGHELWRMVGEFDPQKVRDSLK